MPIEQERRERLAAAGFKVGTAAGFPGLTPQEETLIEMRLVLSDCIRDRRRVQRLSQSELAKRLRSSQSRVAKIEAGDASVSMDLMMKALPATGATRAEVGAVMAGRAGEPPPTAK